MRASRVTGHVAVEIDGVRIGPIPVEQVRGLGLHFSIDVATHARLLRAADAARAYRSGVRLLATRGRSVMELSSRLRRKGFAPTVVAEAIERLEEGGLLEDTRFAAEYAAGRAARGYGRARVLAELGARGVERRVAERAADQVFDDAGEQAGRIEAIARRRARQLLGYPAPVRLRRLAAFLARRGVAAGEALELAKRLTANPTETPDPLE